MTAALPDPVHPLRDLWSAWRLRWKRRQLLWRAIRARHALTPVADRTAAIRPGDVLVIATLRNEALRLPGFLDHYRSHGAAHFLIVDNDSTDGSTDDLSGQPDVSLWRAQGPYRAARFGMDWAGWLLARYGHGHWCVTVDADELLIWPRHDTGLTLPRLTEWLDSRGIPAMGALMLDLFPHGPIGAPIPPDAGVLDHLQWFDPGPYATRIHRPRLNRQTQGGTRARALFADDPARAPTLNKLPLIRWNRRFVYVNSTHSILPRRLNAAWDGPGDPRMSGVLLHTKFLPDTAARAVEDTARRQHFADPDRAAFYYRALADDPVLWHPGAVRLTGWRQLADLGLMGTGSLN